MEGGRTGGMPGRFRVIDTKEASEKLVRGFLGAWTEGDIDTICSSFADGAVYHNVPVSRLRASPVSA